MDPVYEKSVMSLLGNYFKKHDVADLQKRSYDFFLTHRLSKIIEEEPYIEVQVKKNLFFRVEFGQTFVDKPYIVDEKRIIQYICPSEALLRDLTYSSVVSVTIHTFLVQKNEEGEEILEEKTHLKIPFARIPMMVGCSMCNLNALSPEDRRKKGHCDKDPGGYFIIKGKERVLVAQERINYNIVYVFEKKMTDQKHVMVSEIRSMSEETGHSVLVQMKIVANNLRVFVSLPFIAQDIPLGYVFMAYGCTLEKIEQILRQNLGYRQHKDLEVMIKAVMRDGQIIQDEEHAIQYIAQFATHVVSKDRRVQYVRQILMNEVFPHLGISSHEDHKMLFLGHMCAKTMLTLTGHRAMDDRDHLSNKRIEVSGTLVGDLFRTLWKRFTRTIEPQLSRRQDILIIISKMNLITMGLRHCFSTGNWGIPKSNYIRTGVSQVLSRLTFNSTLSHLRRIVIPIGKEGRNTKIRQVHPTQIGFFCSSETPEGSSAGIVKNFALLSEVSLAFDPIFMRMILEKLPGIVTDSRRFLQTTNTKITKVILNGNWMGVVTDGEAIMSLMTRMKRESKLIPPCVSLTHDVLEAEIRVFCDEGRMIRPLFVASRMPTLEEMKGEAAWEKMVERGQIVWVDSHELEDMVVAMYPHEIREGITDYCEIHPCLILGICASIMPYADHTQSPRICYHSSMVKQAIGIYSGTNEIRADTVVHVLCQPERLLVRSHVEEWMGMDDLPCGNNVIMAIACYGGWNQEDSIILNQSSVDKGLFRSFTYRSLMVEEKKKTSSHIETIELPPLEIRIRSFQYSKLDRHGIILPGVFVGSGDVIVGKVSTRQVKMGREDKIDTSVVIKNGEEGYVDKVFITTTPDGYKMVKIKIRSLKIPEIGDKLCSNCAQKGTVGMTLRAEDMPFTPDGIIPDIIINPLCFTGDTRVAFQEGLSRRLDSLSDQESGSVWTFLDSDKKLGVGRAMGVVKKGRSRVVCLKTSMGQSIRCTPDHPFLVKRGESDFVWSRADEIVLEQDRLVVGMDPPEDRVDLLEAEWIYRGLCMGRAEDRERLLAIFRLGGLYMSLDTSEEDTETVLEEVDHQAITDDYDLAGLDRSAFLDMSSPPDILFQPLTPLSIVREFIAGLWGERLRAEKRELLWTPPHHLKPPFVQRLTSLMVQRFDFGLTVRERTGQQGCEVVVPVAFLKQVGIRYFPRSMLHLTAVRYGLEAGVKDLDRFLEDHPVCKEGGYRTTKVVSRHQEEEEQIVYCLGVESSHNFVANGLVVHNCIPSRMTINQLMEAIGAKSAVMKGKRRYATTFSTDSVDIVDTLKQELHECGYEKNGNEMLINGITGKPMDVEIFIGPTYYHRLKHLVGSKIHARNHGKVSTLTHQPLEGRSRDGGLRFGEMERDCMISHGTSRFLLERLFDMSDPFRVPLCTKCGVMPSSLQVCPVCDGTEIRVVPMPYACKLLFQELNAMGIRINLFPEMDRQSSSSLNVPERALRLT